MYECRGLASPLRATATMIHARIGYIKPGQKDGLGFQKPKPRDVPPTPPKMFDLYLSSREVCTN